MKASHVAMVFASLLFISTPAKSQCASTTVTTGLGSCIDFMAATSDLVTNQINSLGYTFAYAAGSYTNYDTGVIYIQNYNCDQAENAGLYYRLSVLAHELGHAEYGVRQDTSTRNAYIQSWCDNEGYAVVNNSKARTEALTCSANSVDISLAASNASELLSMHASGNGIREIGKSFCEKNITSTTGENYLDFYGRYYDENY